MKRMKRNDNIADGMHRYRAGVERVCGGSRTAENQVSKTSNRPPRLECRGYHV